MGKITDLFGKETNIRPSDIQRLVDDRTEESTTLEYKSLEGLSTLPDDPKEGLIIRPIVAFLNRSQKQSALLVLGVHTGEDGHIPDRVEPIPTSLLDGERLRQLITSQVISIPQSASFPQLRILPVSYPGSKNVLLAEVTPSEDTFYYSGITDYAYVRRADTSQKLTLQEAYSLLLSKRASHLTIRFTSAEDSALPSDPSIRRILYHVQCVNVGAKPAFGVAGFLFFDFNPTSSIGVSIRPTFMTDASSANPGHSKALYFQAALQGQTPIYPGDFSVNLGDVEVQLPTGVALTIACTIYHEEGKANLTLTINPGQQMTVSNGPVFSHYE